VKSTSRNYLVDIKPDKLLHNLQTYCRNSAYQKSSTFYATIGCRSGAREMRISTLDIYIHFLWTVSLHTITEIRVLVFKKGVCESISTTKRCCDFFDAFLGHCDMKEMRVWVDRVLVCLPPSKSISYTWGGKCCPGSILSRERAGKMYTHVVSTLLSTKARMHTLGNRVRLNC